jgi:Flp pilus assembly protein TadG
MLVGWAKERAMIPDLRISFHQMLRPANNRVRAEHFCRTAQAAWRDERGIAGVEFALIMSALCFLLLNGADVARYAWIRMQVENAAQVGAQAAWKTCDPDKLPVSTKCPELNGKVTAAVQSTSLGGNVQLQGAPTEGYYCLDTSNNLQPVGTVSSPPSNCAATNRATLLPGDYIKVDVTYQYRPLINGFSIGGYLRTPITETAFLRLK